MPEPPVNLEAERSVLGAMMVTDRAVKAVLGASPLRREHFYNERHRLIFGAASRLAALDQPVDAISVSEELKRTKNSEQAGGSAYLSELASSVPVPGNAQHYAEIVTELAELRARREGAQRIIEGVDKRDREMIREGLEQAHSDFTHAAEPVEPMELADEFAEDLYNDDPIRVLKLPWGRLNNLAGGGLYPGEVTALIGWAGDGKTTALDQTFGYMHGAGAKCLILATEMTRRERIARFCSAVTGIPYARIMLRELSEDQKGKVLDALNRIPFSYRRVKGWDVTDICTEIAMRRPDVVAIDSIHGLAYRDAAELRLISGALAATAAKVGCHILYVCQLNMLRNKEGSAPEPVPRDIRDSGSIEYDATNILSVYRDRGPKGARLDTGKLRWLKCRNGLPGSAIKVELIPGAYGFRPVGAGQARPPEPAAEPLVSVHDDA